MRSTFAQATFMAAFATMTSAAATGVEPIFNIDGSGLVDCDQDTVLRDDSTYAYSALPITKADCEAFPKWAQGVYDEGANNQWESHEITTDDGYVLSMIRFIGNEKGMEKSNQDTFDAVLLIHGAFEDGYDWMDDRTHHRRSALPISLFDRKLDVWIANMRGTVDSLKHSTFDLNTTDGQKSYWNFDIKDSGENDISAAVNKIMQVRMANRYETERVNILTTDSGAGEAFLYAVSGDSTVDHVRQIMVLAPALIYKQDHLIGGLVSSPPPADRLRTLSDLLDIDIDANGNERVGRSLKRLARKQEGDPQLPEGVDGTLQRE